MFGKRHGRRMGRWFLTPTPKKREVYGQFHTEGVVNRVLVYKRVGMLRSWGMRWSDLHVDWLSTGWRIDHRRKGLEEADQLPYYTLTAVNTLFLSSDYKQPSFHSCPKVGPFLSLNACFNLQTNILRSFQGPVNNVLQSWSLGTWWNHPDSSTSICVGSLLEHPSRKDCVLSTHPRAPVFSKSLLRSWKDKLKLSRNRRNHLVKLQAVPP